ncbi:MAG: sulfatase-like hydrolase/transferase [Terracidiphilus sp.]
MRIRALLESTGASLLILLPYFGQLLFPNHLLLYHHHLPLANIVGGLLLDALVLVLLGIFLREIPASVSPSIRRIAGACLTAFFLLRFANLFLILLLSVQGGTTNILSPSARSIFARQVAEWWAQCSHPILGAVTTVLVVLAWVRPGSARTVERVCRVSLSAFAFCALWIVPELLYIGFGLQAVLSYDRLSAQAQSVPHKRIVWLLFDELSYDLVFDHRPSGQEFPNFQKFRSQSSSFSDIQPIGILTERIIPSLLSGREIDQIRGTRDGGLLTFDPGQNRWVTYNAAETLFGEAQRGGWNPGVAGWYNPYCRTFNNEISNCDWIAGIQAVTPFEAIGGSESKSILANSLVLPRAYLARLNLRKQDAREDLLKRNIEDYTHLMTQAQSIIQEEQVHFLFIHLPVPHPPGIYNRETHQFAQSGNYLDNLELADQTMGVLMKEIERTSSANQTTVIVSSDHSWRVPIWRNSPGWTPEEERVSQGRFEPRPVFLVHFPGQTSGDDVTTSTSELIEHGIIEAMLHGQLQSPTNLDALVSESVRPKAEASAPRQLTKADGAARGDAPPLVHPQIAFGSSPRTAHVRQ